MQRAAAYLISIVLLLTGYFYSNTLQYETTGEAEQLTRAIVLDMKEVTETDNEEYFPDERQWEVKLEITQGAYKGREVLAEHYAGLNPAFDFTVLPAILAGINPILITVVVCTGITIVTHMLISGFSKKSLAAITGTMIGVVLGGALANYVIALTRGNGLGTEEARLFSLALPRASWTLRVSFMRG